MFGNSTPVIDTSDDNTWRRSCEHCEVAPEVEDDGENADVYDIADNANARERLLITMVAVVCGR